MGASDDPIDIAPKITYNSIYEAGEELIDMHGASPIIRGNIIGPNTVGFGGIVVDGKAPVIENNTIQNISGAGITIEVNFPSFASITNNKIINNQIGIQFVPGSKPENVRINFNQIYSNGFNIDFRADENYSVDARNNWWGTSEKEEIEENIFDSADEPGYGDVLFKPFLSSAVYQTKAGTLEQDETWSGEILVTGGITVPQGVTLTIGPGTSVVFKHYRGYKEPEKNWV